MAKMKVIDAPTYDEAVIRVKTNLRHIDDDVKRDFLYPRIRRIYINYLESLQKHK